MRLPFAAAAVGIALGEAWVAGESAWQDGLDLADTGTAALAATAVALACAWPLAWLADALTRTAGGRALVRGLHEGLAAGRSVTLACLVFCAALGASAASIVWLAPTWTRPLSTLFAVLATVLTAVVLPLVVLLIVAGPSHAIGRRLVPRRAVVQALDRALGPWLVGGAAAFVLAAYVAPRYAFAPAGAVVLLGASLLGPWRTRSLRWIAVAVLLAGLAGVAALDRMPAAAAGIVAYRTAYAGLALGLAQRVLDADGDGASPILLGGDCNDADRRVHPGAREIPGNRIDENCTGRDAPRQRPLRAPTMTRPASLAKQHDLVLIFVDALRPDHLSLAGYPRRTTPNIDALAHEGTWFRNAYTTAPSTRFAMASLFTGRDVRRLRFRDLGGNNFELSSGAPTIARRLRDAGYTTTGFTVSYVAQHNVGTGQGFQTWKTPWPVRDWRKIRDRNAELTTDAAISELEETPAEERLLLFAHYDCPHDPYRLHDSWDFGRRPIDLYDSALAYCDSQIGRLLKALRARANWNETAVFLVSDHGELFGEHGLTNHGNSLYEPDVRIALIARVPGTEPRVVDAPVQLHDVAPTMLELASLSPAFEDDAWSLLGKIFGSERPTPRPLFMFTELERGSVRYDASAVLDWPHKLVRDHHTRSVSLFDVVADPGERRSLVDTRPDIAGRLVDLLDGYDAWAVP